MDTASGGVANAVKTSAESVYEQLDPDGQQITRDVFRRLMTVSRTGLLTRRRTTRKDLYTAVLSVRVMSLLLRVGRSLGDNQVRAANGQRDQGGDRVAGAVAGPQVGDQGADQ